MSREMKHSGIEWIREIPKEWNICRLKDVGTLYGGLTGKAGDDFNVEEDDISYMLYIPFTNIFNNDSINPNQLFKVKIEQGEKQNLVQKGDLLFLMSSEDYDGVGKPAIMEEQVDDLGLNSFCKGLRIYNNNTNSKFLFYLLSSHLHRELVRQEAKGFIRINLRQDRLSCCPIFLPPLPEQQKIANYLDEVCGEVDEMVALQETMIEELKAYKQSVITEAVTKGLNPNVPMKDSGIDWIGEVPELWEIRRLKYVAQTMTKGSGITKEEVFPNGDTPCVRYGEIYSKYNGVFRECFSKTRKALLPVTRYFCHGDILFAGTGELVEEIGKNIVYMGDSPCLAGGDIIIMKHKQDPIFLNFLLNSQYAQNQKSCSKTKLKVVHISSTEIGDILVALPPLSEQHNIASYLDTKCAEIDAIIALKQAKIEELKEYKKSVIYEYVTGKKEVV